MFYFKCLTKMNWKLLLLTSTLILGISARPADDNSQETSTLKSLKETTNITERPTIVITDSPIEIVTKKTITKTAEKVPVSDSIATSHVPTTTSRYLASQSLQTKPTTNAKMKYANNYDNLITKHTLNSHRINNKMPNITVDADSNSNSKNNDELNLNYVISSDSSSSIINQLTLNDFVKNITSVDHNKLSIPIATISSPTTSNSSSKPLVFVDADATYPHFTELSTTKRAFIQLNDNSQIDGWSNYNLEDTSQPTLTTTRKKPVIHKIISKWSDNPSEVFNYGHEPIIPAQLNELKNQIVQSAYIQQQKYSQPSSKLPPPKPFIPSISSFDNLPTIIGQQLLHQQQHISTIKPDPSVKPLTSNKPSISDLLLLNRPSSFESLKDYCKNIQIKLGSKYSGSIDSMEQCKGINFIDNKIENSNLQPSTADYEVPESENSNHEEVPSVEIYENVHHHHNTGPNAIVLPFATTIIPGSIKIGNVNSNNNKAKKTKPKQGEIEEEGSTDMGSMAWSVLTMAAIFNPLNFGVWGMLLSPVAAITLGGMCFVMYKFLKHDKHEHGHHHGHHHHAQIHHHHGGGGGEYHKPHEIIIKNKINHEAIPIKVEHFHKHIPALHKLVYSHYSHHHPAPKAPPRPPPPPPIMHESPVMEYSPPWHTSTGKQSYGEPPVDSYLPSAPEGGPYKRKSSMSKHKTRKHNPFKYKLL